MIPATSIRHVRAQGHPVDQVLSRIESCVRRIEGSDTPESLVEVALMQVQGLQSFSTNPILLQELVDGLQSLLATIRSHSSNRINTGYMTPLFHTSELVKPTQL